MSHRTSTEYFTTDRPATFPVRNGVAENGKSFEINLCCLVYLRCHRHCDSFHLALNHGAAGSFDDLVLYLKPRGNDKYYGCFVQCKFKSKRPNTDVLFKNDKDFGLCKYFSTYLKFNETLRCLRTSRDQCIFTDRCFFVIFTNTQVTVSTETNDITRGCLKDVLNTDGSMKFVRYIPKNCFLHKMYSSQPKLQQFLNDFVLCDQQANNVELENMIQSEIQEILKVEPAKAKILYSTLYLEVKKWCEKNDENDYITEKSSIWQNVQDTYNESTESQTNFKYKLPPMPLNKASVVKEKPPLWQDVQNACKSTSVNKIFQAPTKYMSLSEASKFEEKSLMWQESQNASSSTVLSQINFQSKLLEPMKYMSLNDASKVALVDSAIHIAARKGNIASLNELLNQGVDIETLGARQMTPLHCAAFKGRYDATSLLLDRGADIHRRSAELERTALHYVAVRGSRDVMALLLRCGGVVNSPDSKGDLPLHIAAWKGHIGLFEDILDAGTDVNARGHWNRTALHWAAQVGHLDIITVLLKRGADMSARDQSGKTALDLARTKGYDNAIKILLASKSCSIRQ